MTEKVVIRRSIKKAKEEEKHHLVSEKELKEQDREFQSEAKGLKKFFTRKFWAPAPKKVAGKSPKKK